MKVQLSPRNRAAIFIRLASVKDWGGSEEMLLTRGRIWNTLNLKVFEKEGEKLDPEKLSRKAQPWDFTRDMAEHTIAALVSVGANAQLALDYIEIVTALRAVFPKEKPKEAAP